MPNQTHANTQTRTGQESEQREPSSAARSPGVSNTTATQRVEEARAALETPPTDPESLLDWFSNYEIANRRTSGSRAHSGYQGAGGNAHALSVPRSVIYDTIETLLREHPACRLSVMSHPRILLRYVRRLTQTQQYDLNFLATYGHVDEQNADGGRGWTPEFARLAAVKRHVGLRLEGLVHYRLPGDETVYKVNLISMLERVGSYPEFQALKTDRRFHEDLRSFSPVRYRGDEDADGDGDGDIIESDPYRQALILWGFAEPDRDAADLEQPAEEGAGITGAQLEACRAFFETIVSNTVNALVEEFDEWFVDDEDVAAILQRYQGKVTRDDWTLNWMTRSMLAGIEVGDVDTLPLRSYLQQSGIQPGEYLVRKYNEDHGSLRNEIDDHVGSEEHRRTAERVLGYRMESAAITEDMELMTRDLGSGGEDQPPAEPITMTQAIQQVRVGDKLLTWKIHDAAERMGDELSRFGWGFGADGDTVNAIWNRLVADVRSVHDELTQLTRTQTDVETLTFRFLRDSYTEIHGSLVPHLRERLGDDEQRECKVLARAGNLVPDQALPEAEQDTEAEEREGEDELTRQARELFATLASLPERPLAGPCRHAGALLQAYLPSDLSADEDGKLARYRELHGIGPLQHARTVAHAAVRAYQNPGGTGGAASGTGSYQPPMNPGQRELILGPYEDVEPPAAEQTPAVEMEGHEEIANLGVDIDELHETAESMWQATQAGELQHFERLYGQYSASEQAREIVDAHFRELSGGIDWRFYVRSMEHSRVMVGAGDSIFLRRSSVSDSELLVLDELAEDGEVSFKTELRKLAMRDNGEGLIRQIDQLDRRERFEVFTDDQLIHDIRAAVNDEQWDLIHRILTGQATGIYDRVNRFRNRGAWFDHTDEEGMEEAIREYVRTRKYEIIREVQQDFQARGMPPIPDAVAQEAQTRLRIELMREATNPDVRALFEEELNDEEFADMEVMLFDPDGQQSSEAMFSGDRSTDEMLQALRSMPTAERTRLAEDPEFRTTLIRAFHSEQDLNEALAILESDVEPGQEDKLVRLDEKTHGRRGQGREVFDLLLSLSFEEHQELIADHELRAQVRGSLNRRYQEMYDEYMAQYGEDMVSREESDYQLRIREQEYLHRSALERIEHAFSDEDDWDGLLKILVEVYKMPFEPVPAEEPEEQLSSQVDDEGSEVEPETYDYRARLWDDVQPLLPDWLDDVDNTVVQSDGEPYPVRRQIREAVLHQVDPTTFRVHHAQRTSFWSLGQQDIETIGEAIANASDELLVDQWTNVKQVGADGEPSLDQLYQDYLRAWNESEIPESRRATDDPRVASARTRFMREPIDVSERFEELLLTEDERRQDESSVSVRDHGDWHDWMQTVRRRAQALPKELIAERIENFDPEHLQWIDNPTRQTLMRRQVRDRELVHSTGLQARGAFGRVSRDEEEELNLAALDYHREVYAEQASGEMGLVSRERAESLEALEGARMDERLTDYNEAKQRVAMIAGIIAGLLVTAIVTVITGGLATGPVAMAVIGALTGAAAGAGSALAQEAVLANQYDMADEGVKEIITGAVTGALIMGSTVASSRMIANLKSARALGGQAAAERVITSTGQPELFRVLAFEGTEEILEENMQGVAEGLLALGDPGEIWRHGWDEGFRRNIDDAGARIQSIPMTSVNAFLQSVAVGVAVRGYGAGRRRLQNQLGEGTERRMRDRARIDDPDPGRQGREHLVRGRQSGMGEQVHAGNRSQAQDAVQRAEDALERSGLGYRLGGGRVDVLENLRQFGLEDTAETFIESFVSYVAQGLMTGDFDEENVGEDLLLAYLEEWKEQHIGIHSRHVGAARIRGLVERDIESEAAQDLTDVERADFLNAGGAFIDNMQIVYSRGDVPGGDNFLTLEDYLGARNRLVDRALQRWRSGPPELTEEQEARYRAHARNTPRGAAFAQLLDTDPRTLPELPPAQTGAGRRVESEGVEGSAETGPTDPEGLAVSDDAVAQQGRQDARTDLQDVQNQAHQDTETRSGDRDTETQTHNHDREPGRALFDAAALASSQTANSWVGNPLESEAAAHQVLRGLASGDRAALAAVGVGPLPDDFDPRSIEWGIGRTDDGQFIIVRGMGGAVDWSELGLAPVAHSHPMRSGKELEDRDGDRSASLDLVSVLGGTPRKAAVDFLPSTSDFRYPLSQGQTSHTVHTPYVYRGDGMVGNPTPDQSGPTISIDMSNLEDTGVGMFGGVVYQADVTIRAGGEVIWQGPLRSTYSAALGDLTSTEIAPGNAAETGEAAAEADTEPAAGSEADGESGQGLFSRMWSWLTGSGQDTGQETSQKVESARDVDHTTRVGEAGGNTGSEHERPSVQLPAGEGEGLMGRAPVLDASQRSGRHRRGSHDSYSARDAEGEAFDVLVPTPFGIGADSEHVANHETVAGVRALEAFGGPRYLGDVRVQNAEGNWVPGVALERIPGAVNLGDYLAEEGPLPPFEITEAHFRGIDETLARFREQGVLPADRNGESSFGVAGGFAPYITQLTPEGRVVFAGRHGVQRAQGWHYDDAARNLKSLLSKVQERQRRARRNPVSRAIGRMFGSDPEAEARQQAEQQEQTEREAAREAYQGQETTELAPPAAQEGVTPLRGEGQLDELVMLDDVEYKLRAGFKVEERDGQRILMIRNILLKPADNVDERRQAMEGEANQHGEALSQLMSQLTQNALASGFDDVVVSYERAGWSSSAKPGRRKPLSLGRRYGRQRGPDLSEAGFTEEMTEQNLPMLDEQGHGMVARVEVPSGAWSKSVTIDGQSYRFVGTPKITKDGEGRRIIELSGTSFEPQGEVSVAPAARAAALEQFRAELEASMFAQGYDGVALELGGQSTLEYRPEQTVRPEPLTSWVAEEQTGDQTPLPDTTNDLASTDQQREMMARVSELPGARQGEVDGPASAVIDNQQVQNIDGSYWWTPQQRGNMAVAGPGDSTVLATSLAHDCSIVIATYADGTRAMMHVHGGQASDPAGGLEAFRAAISDLTTIGEPTDVVVVYAEDGRHAPAIPEVQELLSSETGSANVQAINKGPSEVEGRAISWVDDDGVTRFAAQGVDLSGQETAFESGTMSQEAMARDQTSPRVESEALSGAETETAGTPELREDLPAGYTTDLFGDVRALEGGTADEETLQRLEQAILRQVPDIRLLRAVRQGDARAVIRFLVPGGGELGIKSLNDKLVGMEIADEIIAGRQAALESAFSRVPSFQLLDQDFKSATAVSSEEDPEVLAAQLREILTDFDAQARDSFLVGLERGIEYWKMKRDSFAEGSLEYNDAVARIERMTSLYGRLPGMQIPITYGTAPVDYQEPGSARAVNEAGGAEVIEEGTPPQTTQLELEGRTYTQITPMSSQDMPVDPETGEPEPVPLLNRKAQELWDQHKVRMVTTDDQGVLGMWQSNLRLVSVSPDHLEHGNFTVTLEHEIGHMEDSIADAEGADSIWGASLHGRSGRDISGRVAAQSPGFGYNSGSYNNYGRRTGAYMSVSEMRSFGSELPAILANVDAGPLDGSTESVRTLLESARHNLYIAQTAADGLTEVLAQLEAGQAEVESRKVTTDTPEGPRTHRRHDVVIRGGQNVSSARIPVTQYNLDMLELEGSELRGDKARIQAAKKKIEGILALAGQAESHMQALIGAIEDGSDRSEAAEIIDWHADMLSMHNQIVPENQRRVRQGGGGLFGLGFAGLRADTSDQSGAATEGSAEAHAAYLAALEAEMNATKAALMARQNQDGERGLHFSDEQFLEFCDRAVSMRQQVLSAGNSLTVNFEVAGVSANRTFPLFVLDPATGDLQPNRDILRDVRKGKITAAHVSESQHEILALFETYVAYVNAFDYFKPMTAGEMETVMPGRVEGAQELIDALRAMRSSSAPQPELADATSEMITEDADGQVRPKSGDASEHVFFESARENPDRIIISADIIDLGLDAMMDYSQRLETTAEDDLQGEALRGQSNLAGDNVLEFKRQAVMRISDHYKELWQARIDALGDMGETEQAAELAAEPEPMLLLGGDEITLSLHPAMRDDLATLAKTFRTAANARVAVSRAQSESGTARDNIAAHETAMKMSEDSQGTLKEFEVMHRKLRWLTEELPPWQRADALARLEALDLMGMYAVAGRSDTELRRLADDSAVDRQELLGQVETMAAELAAAVEAHRSQAKPELTSEDVLAGYVRLFEQQDLRPGAMIPVRSGEKSAALMGALHQVLDREIALVRLESNEVALILGSATGVPIPPGGRIIAHTHPAGSAGGFSGEDVAELAARGQRSSLLVDTEGRVERLRVNDERARLGEENIPDATGGMSMSSGPTALADILRIGSQVSVTRSSGEVQGGWVIDGYAGGRVEVRSGDLVKTYDPAALVGQNPQLLVGHQVRVRRSSGQLEDDWHVVQIQGGVAIVANGQGAQKGVPIASLLEINGISSQNLAAQLEAQPAQGQQQGVDPAVQAVIDKFGLPLSHSVEAGGASYQVSDLFDMGGGRLAVIARVTVGGQSTHQVFYRSNSQGIFRLLPATNSRQLGVLGLPGFDKGMGEHGLDAPPAMQAFLSSMMAEGSARTDIERGVVMNEVVGAVVPRNENFDDYQAYKESDQHVSKHVEVRQADTSSPEAQPDFSQLLHSYPAATATAGSVTALVYPSRDGSLQYTLFKDSEDRIWVASIASATSEVNALGLPSVAIEPADKNIMCPLWEYHQQIPGGHAGETHPTMRQYASAWPFLSQHPMIRAWYQATGIRVPGEEQQLVQEPAEPTVVPPPQEPRAAATPTIDLSQIFVPGTAISVRRSSGEVQSGWQITHFDGDRVHAAAPGMTRPSDWRDILLINPQLLQGARVGVMRSSGDLEPGWRVMATSPEGRVRVSSADGSMFKDVGLEDLLAWNGLSPAATTGEAAADALEERADEPVIDAALLEHYVSRDESVPRKRGIGGAHNRDEFMKHTSEFTIESEVPHGSAPGVSVIEYRMAKLDITGNPTGEFQSRIHTKTVYDPAVWSESELMRVVEEAARDASRRGEFGREWVGTSSDGYRIRGYQDDGRVTSFFFD